MAIVKTKLEYYDRLFFMDMHTDLSYMETLYMALADKTRLRLLNLMRDHEICVCFFAEVLGDSQPKISRHLAYLRNAGIVEARRDGKWMHYSIRWPDDDGGSQVLTAALDWLAAKEEMQEDRQKYRVACCSPDVLINIARTPMPFISVKADMNEDEPSYLSANSAHNELEEFLL